ncbi:unnamed protein product [Rotaria sp. Silwood1]|nr:unnamed protein product [Rotaria sp. Silwood1]CAF1154896.1 unnamed protein product [Rotaria sp. Silwood1]
MMMFSWLLFSLLIGSTICCSCIQRPTLKDDFARTPIIFIGRVIDKIPPPLPYNRYEFTVEVEEALKGTSVGAQIKVRTWEQGSMCGIGLVSVGSHWQIWLSENGVTSLCTRTTSNIDENRLALRELANHSS